MISADTHSRFCLLTFPLPSLVERTPVKQRRSNSQSIRSSKLEHRRRLSEQLRLKAWRFDLPTGVFRDQTGKY